MGSLLPMSTTEARNVNEDKKHYVLSCQNWTVGNNQSNQSSGLDWVIPMGL